ncbi:MAG: thioesterase family protein [Magnetovibrionaceae bacterium]
MAEPLITEVGVKDDWIDYNGHLNVAYYVLAFDYATDALLAEAGINENWRQANQASVFVVEAHTAYENEVGRGARLFIESHLVGVQPKRLQLFHVMTVREENAKPVRVASQEIMAVSVDLQTRRSAPLPADILARLEAMKAEGGFEEADLGRSIRKLKS